MWGEGAETSAYLFFKPPQSLWPISVLRHNWGLLLPEKGLPHGQVLSSQHEPTASLKPQQRHN